jgi:adenylate kinase family enzyme
LFSVLSCRYAFVSLETNMLLTIADSLITKIVDAAWNRFSGKSKDGSVETPTLGDFDAALAEHMLFVQKWAGEISFRDMASPRRLNTSFVDLELRLGFVATESEFNNAPKARASDLAWVHKHMIILGESGAGKTTTLKKVAADLLGSYRREEGALLLVQLREHTRVASLGSVILRTLDISPTLNSELITRVIESEAEMGDKVKSLSSLEDMHTAIEQELAMRYVDRPRMTILIDGLDELPLESRENVVRDLRRYLRTSKFARFIVTCRRGEYQYHLENSIVFTMLSLSDEQISELVDRWLGPQKRDDFLLLLRNNPYGGSEVRPLTLAHLCAIYERSGTIPDTPRTIYRKIVRLFLEEWDEQRSIQRTSRYSNFQIDRKEDFLEALAYHLTVRGGRSRFTHSELELCYNEIHEAFSLPQSDVTKVIREVESHTGLVVEIYRETYEFSHRSIQEYLAASYVLKLPEIPTRLTSFFPNETAVAVALSSDRAAYFSAVVDRIIELEPELLATFLLPFLSRLEVERSGFTRSARVGLAVLRLISTVYLKVRHVHDGDVVAETLRFANTPQIIDSIAGVLEDSFAVQSEAEGTIEIVSEERMSPSRPMHFSLPTEMLKAVERRGPLLRFRTRVAPTPL